MENYKQWMEQKLTSEDMDKLPKVVKPLTEDQINAICSEFSDMGGDIQADYWVDLCRAIEKAHGIV